MKNTQIELGKEYNFAGYRWVPVRINKEDQVAVMQSLGVTAGPWPGFSMPLYGNGDFYDKDIFGEDISSYNEATEKLMEHIRPVAVDTVSGRGLYLASFKDIDSVEDIRNNSVWENALIKAATNSGALGIYGRCSWLGTVNGKRAWYIGSDGCTSSYYDQHNVFVIAPAFNLDLKKIEIEGDEIRVKGTHDGSDHTQKNTVRMRVMAVRYGYAVVEAESEEDAIELANNLPDSQFDWSDPDDIQVVDDNIDE